MDAETRELIRSVRDAVAGERYRSAVRIGAHDGSFVRRNPPGYDDIDSKLILREEPEQGGQMALSGSAKELRPLLDAIKANGFKVVPSGKHHKVVDVEGRLGAKNKVVTDSNGPIIISSTPGDFRARDMHVKRLMKAQIIKKDPWARDKGEGKDERESSADPEAVAKRRQAIARASRERAAKTNELRARIEPIIAKLGGWDKYGLVTELSAAAYTFLKANNRVECWESEGGAMQNARQLKAGNTLSDKATAAWAIFCDELEKAWRPVKGGIPDDDALRDRYFEMVRAAKGIKEPEPEQGPEVKETEEPLVETPREQRRNGFVRHGLMDEKLPTLALKAVFLMAQQGEGDDARTDEVLAVGEEILRLELASLDDA